MNRFKLIGVSCAVAALSIVSFGQAPTTTAAPASQAPVQTPPAPATEMSYSLKRIVKTGDSIKFSARADIEFPDPESPSKKQQFVYSSDITETIADAAADGSYKVQSTQANSKISQGDSEQEIPPQAGKNVITYDATGEVLEITGDMVESGAYRMANLGVLKAPDAPVKIGDSWTYKISANTKTGAVAATAEYKVLGTEKIGDRDTVKISVNFKETEGSVPASNVGTEWVDAKDFSMVKSDTIWTNAPIPGAPGPINGKVVLTRV